MVKSRRKSCGVNRIGAPASVSPALRAKQNRRDVEMLHALRAQKRITGEFRIDHLPGPATPLLAVGDITAGAVMASYAGEDSYRAFLRSKLTIIEV